MRKYVVEIVYNWKRNLCLFVAMIISSIVSIWVTSVFLTIIDFGDYTYLFFLIIVMILSFSFLKFSKKHYTGEIEVSISDKRIIIKEKGELKISEDISDIEKIKCKMARPSFKIKFNSNKKIKYHCYEYSDAVAELIDDLILLSMKLDK